ncbi:hypothetical protein [Vibrio crassostreae]|uniref:hypothetical protein n=1 Tax=Vibrio crassostreae TaxID=246167 RepID=UPI002E171C32|nr:MotA/TolQ/ExbB proton channel family protein [Vibrio crassostreae]
MLLGAVFLSLAYIGIRELYYLGYFSYVIMAYTAINVESINIMVTQSLELAFELTVAMFTLLVYPLGIAIFHLVTRKFTKSDLNFLASQSKISASFCVSLGLIGTFQGLTAMVISIASSMSGDGDVTEKMGAMVESIASALNAMSYAFLTSIMGVAISVIILLGYNFWSQGYNRKDKRDNTIRTLEAENRVVFDKCGNNELRLIEDKLSAYLNERLKFESDMLNHSKSVADTITIISELIKNSIEKQDKRSEMNDKRIELMLRGVEGALSQITSQGRKLDLFHMEQLEKNRILKDQMHHDMIKISENCDISYVSIMENMSLMQNEISGKFSEVTNITRLIESNMEKTTEEVLSISAYLKNVARVLKAMFGFRR